MHYTTQIYNFILFRYTKMRFILTSTVYNRHLKLIMFVITITYSTAQFKLDRTRVQHGLDMTYFLFHMCASMCVHTRLVMSNLPCIALMYALDVCTMRACMSGMHTPNLDYACMQIVSQGQRNKLYKHVHVLKYNLLMIQDVNPAK